MTTSVTAVQESLVFADASIPPDYTSAMSYSLLWSQSVARKENPGSMPSSKPYYDSMATELNRIAWIVTDGNETSYTQQASRFSIADVVQGVLSSELDSEQTRRATGMLRGLQQPQHSSFLQFWLGHSESTSVASMAVGPLFETQGQPSVKLIWYSFDAADENWQSFFVASDRSALEVSLRSFVMTLNVDLWKNGIQTALADKLEGSINKYVQNLQLDV